MKITQHGFVRAVAMRKKRVFWSAVAGVVLSCSVGLTVLAQQDRNALKVPDGLAFSDFNGYDTWQDVAVSETQGSVKAILGNPAMIQAYKDGIPDNGKAFPEGVKVVKIEWVKKKSALSPYFVEVPDTLKTLSFIEKDSNRFPKTHGWAYAQFEYDPASKTLKPSVTGAECGYACHTKIASKDYIWTEYPPR
ncbi:MAG TPA: cytochrome P460 family protein [Verrucomicrobiae bacterium]|nr:cytochrome P460 family protein [Verrucomicrobiae bacterium]